MTYDHKCEWQCSFLLFAPSNNKGQIQFVVDFKLSIPVLNTSVEIKTLCLIMACLK